MKQSILLAGMLVTIIGFANKAQANTPDSTLARKVQILEQKVASQQKDIDLLKKMKKPAEGTYVIDRRGSKQYQKKD